MGRNDMPRVIAAFLDSGICWFVARLVLTFVFWSAGLAHLIDFQHSVAELKTLGLEPAAHSQRRAGRDACWSARC